ncbi:tyrosine-type recombinase/integrase [Fimbriiglobus ruber]|uniref:Tyr recombinase domain-containing protein n=1 Tax=Fimbriiglobus ruber TaxID=1908690 RepID=A0A225DCR6_9BACT|nr:tyrosine-type recombinase/integrase [Fimbriiglobus ruber]OWK34185.1 hypothetical protein FRUB_10156 [Fimbriiglobus ruber]
MASLIRPSRPYPLPTGAEVVTRTLAKPKKLKSGAVVREWRFVRVKDGKKTLDCPLSADGTKYLKPSKKWYAKYRDADGVVRKVPLSANKDAAQQMLAEIVRKQERKKAGLHDPFEQHTRNPLAQHLDVWEATLKADGAGEKHARETARCARQVFARTGAVFVADVSASRVQQFLAELRNARTDLPAVDPAQEVFTKAQAAAALGVKPSAIPSLVKRHRLTATGNGKARRYPRAIVAALRARRATGMSVKTTNLYLDAAKAFMTWLVLDRRAGQNPLAHLSGGNVKLDRRHDRRPLSADELRRLLRAAETNPAPFRGLAGPDRVVLYAVAGATGFRAEELARLSPVAFDLNHSPPTVSLGAKDTKNGKSVVQPLPGELTEILTEYLADRTVDQPVWPGTWYQRAADMIRLDEDLAGIPYAVSGPDGPLYADFHCLRHTFIALLDRSGATLKEAMQLARHSDPKLTMAVYGRARLTDLGAAVGRLPSILCDSPAIEAAATGPRSDVPRDVPAGDSRGYEMGAGERGRRDCGENSFGPNLHALQ